MIEKTDLELVYSTTQIIGCFNKKRLLEFYDILKNRLIKYNRKHLPYEKVEISSLSSIDKENIYKYKERLTKQEFEDMHQEIRLHNIEGEYVFEYQANYEISIFKDPDMNFKVSEGKEVEYYYDLQHELQEEKKVNNKMFGFDGALFDLVRERNFPKYSKDLEEKYEKNGRDYRIRFAIWAEKNNWQRKVDSILLGGSAFGIFNKPPDEELNQIKISEKDRERERSVRKKYKEEQIKEQNKRIEEIKKSWE